MTDELRARFLRPFLATSRERLRRCYALIHSSGSDRGATAREMHAMAGEAALIGFGEVAKLARDAELAARRWTETGDATTGATVADSLAALDAAVEALGRTA